MCCLSDTRLEKFFGQIGQIKDDKKSKEKGKKKIWIYRNKQSGAPKGDATVTFTDASGARFVECFGFVGSSQANSYFRWSLFT